MSFAATWIVVVQSLSCVWHFVTPWTAAYQASQSFTISRSLLKLTSIELMMDLDIIIRNEVNQTDKDKYNILSLICRV